MSVGHSFKHGFDFGRNAVLELCVLNYGIYDLTLERSQHQDSTLRVTATIHDV